MLTAAVELTDFAHFYSTCLRVGDCRSGPDGIRGPGPNLIYELLAPSVARVLPVPECFRSSVAAASSSFPQAARAVGPIPRCCLAGS